MTISHFDCFTFSSILLENRIQMNIDNYVFIYLTKIITTNITRNIINRYNIENIKDIDQSTFDIIVCYKL